MASGICEDACNQLFPNRNDASGRLEEIVSPLKENSGGVEYHFHAALNEEAMREHNDAV